MRTPVALPRSTRRRSVTLACLVVLALAGSVAYDVLAVALERSPVFWDQPRVTRELTSRSWSDDVVSTVAIAVIAVGGLLVVWALLPGRRRHLVLHEPDPLSVLGLERRSAKTLLADAAASVDGIDTASAGLSRRRASVTARSPLRERDGLDALVTAAVEAKAAELDLQPQPRVRTRVRESSS